MPLIRSIGRWSLTALAINCIIGSGIFGVPGELMKTVGRASPLAMVLAGLATVIVVACFAEVSSRFSEPGGVYLFARTAFGRFAGIQVGWFWFLSTLGGAAANANLFLDYLAGLAPWTSNS
ncbi:MAG: amino acid permease, partial [Limisphaerales bacterium]